MKLDDRLIHTIQLFAILATGCILIIFAHDFVSPVVVFSSLIAGLGSIVGSRIASNGYLTPSPLHQTPTSEAMNRISTPLEDDQDTQKTSAVKQ